MDEEMEDACDARPVTITLRLEQWNALLDTRRVDAGLCIARHNLRAEAYNHIRYVIGERVHADARAERNARLAARVTA